MPFAIASGHRRASFRSPTRGFRAGFRIIGRQPRFSSAGTPAGNHEIPRTSRFTRGGARPAPVDRSSLDSAGSSWSDDWERWVEPGRVGQRSATHHNVTTSGGLRFADLPYRDWFLDPVSLE